MKNLNVHLDDELHRRFKVVCAQEAKEMSEVVRQLIQEYVEKSEKKKTKR
jgi:metal-responsive CopG/Arc/MetJ family transcriptional regulator